MPLFLSTIEMQAVNSQFELQLLTFSTTFGIEPSSGTSSQAFNIIVINSTEIDFEKYDNMKLEVRIYNILLFLEMAMRTFAFVKLFIYSEPTRFSYYILSVPRVLRLVTQYPLIYAEVMQ